MKKRIDHDELLRAGHPVLAHEIDISRRKDQRKQQTTKWYIHTYLHADDPTALLPDEAVFDGLQFGGKRDYGHGEVELKNTQMVNLNNLDYTRLKSTETRLIELMTPFVVGSEYPDTDDRPVAWWWAESSDNLRLREETTSNSVRCCGWRQWTTARW